MNRLPAIKVTQGQPFTSSFILQAQDWTGYTGEVIYKKSPKNDETLLVTPATGDALGQVDFALTAEETDAFPTFPVLGWRKVGVYQVRMTDPTNVLTFQGDLFVAGAI